jgi:hypothetical protein
MSMERQRSLFSLREMQRTGPGYQTKGGLPNFLTTTVSIFNIGEIEANIAANNLAELQLRVRVLSIEAGSDGTGLGPLPKENGTRKCCACNGIRLRM